MPSPDVVFVGAGPVGLFAAIQTKLLCPTLNIRLYEKYEQYQREHVLHIDKRSYKGTPPDQRFQEMLSELVDNVPTKMIEERFLAFARELGIEIQYQPILDTQKLAKDHPDTQIIVGSDGSHSLVRKEVFGDKKKIEENLQYIAEIKYKIHGKSRPMRFQMEFLPTLSLVEHFVSEHVGKEVDGQSQVSIRFFVDQQTFEEMQELGVNFKNPLKLARATEIETPGIKKLTTSIQKWLIARADLIGDKQIELSERITAINLPVYRCERFALQHAGKSWFLVGDAALGVPYFRALNAGLLSATKLARAIRAHFYPKAVAEEAVSSYSKMSHSLSKEHLIPVDRYHKDISAIANAEISTAHFKNFGVNSAQSYARSSQTVPVSSLKLNRETRKHIKEVGEDQEKNSRWCAIM
jgi:2-polyprenyl-6-methoxyphenol hydroxylase-like FAD-dependent oxidoreductase